MASTRIGPRTARDRLGWLLKHAHQRWLGCSIAALRGLPINGRELAVLSALGEGEPLSQLEAAQRLGIDRTSMVSLVDDLESKGLVERRPDVRDRRRNIVVLTDRGSRILADGVAATAAAEEVYLDALGPDDRERFRTLLATLAGTEPDA